MKKLGTGIISGAYGRDYKSAAAMLRDFYDNKDFVLHQMGHTTYCSIRDFEPGAVIELRYNKLRTVSMHSMKK